MKTMDDFYVLLFTKLGMLESSSERTSVAALKDSAGRIRRQFQGRIKIYVTLWQIVSLLPFTLDIKFPSVYRGIASVLNIFNLGISVSALVTCSTYATYDAIDNLMFETLYPLFIMCLLWLLRKVHLWSRKGDDPEVLSELSSRYFSIFLVFTYLILPFTSVIIFQTFSCRDVDPDDVHPGDDLYMIVDYSVSCSSSKYKAGFLWAVVCIFVYPLGIPTYYFYVLYSARNDIKNRDTFASESEALGQERRLKPVKLLFEFYEPRLWYWEVFETAHRLLLTGVLVVIAQGSGTQIIVGVMVALTFLKVGDVCRPYVDEKVQMLREICQWQIFFILFLALIVKADFASVELRAMDAFLVLAVIANIVIDTSIFVWDRLFFGLTRGNTEQDSNMISMSVTKTKSPLVGDKRLFLQSASATDAAGESSCVEA